jgi:hypothetical protein
VLQSHPQLGSFQDWRFSEALLLSWSCEWLERVSQAGKESLDSEQWTPTYVADGNKVAEDYLQAQNRKLRKARKKASAKDMAAYKDGQKDSKRIDVRGKRL